MIEDTVIPDQERRRKAIRIVQSLGIVTGGAYVLLAYTRFPAFDGNFAVATAGGLAALVAAGLATSKARVSYWLFLLAGSMMLLDLVVGYVHALFFLGSFLILGALCAINEPDDDEALTLKRLMEEDD